MAYAWPAMRPQISEVMRGIGKLAYIRCAGSADTSGPLKYPYPLPLQRYYRGQREVPGPRRGAVSEKLKTNYLD